MNLEQDPNPRLAPQDVSSTLAAILHNVSREPGARGFLAILGSGRDWDGLSGEVRLTEARWTSNALNLEFDNGQTFALTVAPGRITNE